MIVRRSPPAISLVYERSAAPVCRTADDMAGIFRALLPNDPLEREHLMVAALDRSHRVIEAAVLTVGTSGCTIIDAAQILRYALTRDRVAVALVLCHNHPSGDPQPSADDIRATRVVGAACAAVGLTLLDHIILGAGRYVSMTERGEV